MTFLVMLLVGLGLLVILPLILIKLVLGLIFLPFKLLGLVFRVVFGVTFGVVGLVFRLLFSGVGLVLALLVVVGLALLVPLIPILLVGARGVLLSLLAVRVGGNLPDLPPSPHPSRVPHPEGPGVLLHDLRQPRQRRRRHQLGRDASHAPHPVGPSGQGSAHAEGRL